MSTNSKNIKLLKKINNTDKDCSEDDQKISDIGDDVKGNNYDLFDSDTDSDDENILDRGQK